MDLFVEGLSRHIICSGLPQQLQRGLALTCRGFRDDIDASLLAAASFRELTIDSNGVPPIISAWGFWIQAVCQRYTFQPKRDACA